MDVKINGEDKVVTLLCSLPELWDHFITSVSFSTTETLEFDVVVGALLSEEMGKKSSIGTSSLEAMVVRGQSNERGENLRGTSKSKSEGKKSKLRCQCFNKTEHLKKDCWKRQKFKDDSKK